MFDILNGLKNYFVENGVNCPVFFEYENTQNNCLFIINPSNDENKSAQNLSYEQIANIGLITRFADRESAKQNLEFIHSLLTSYSGVLVDTQGKKGVVQYVEVLNSPQFNAVNAHKDSKQYSSQYNFHYLIP